MFYIGIMIINDLFKRQLIKVIDALLIGSCPPDSTIVICGQYFTNTERTGCINCWLNYAERIE